MMKGLWKKAFSAEYFKIDHKKATIFVKSQWQLQDGISVPYLLYRAVVALFFLAVSIVSLLGIGMIQKWPIYLTNWGITMCTVQAVFALVMVSVAKMREKHQMPGVESAVTGTMPLHYKIYWAIHTIATTAAVCITISYWSVVYKPDKHPLDAVNILTHAVNGIMMLIDLVMIAHPLRIAHIYLPLCFALVYVIFNGIYYLAGGTDRFGRTYIYDILNWEKTGYAFLACLFGLIFIAVMHSVLSAISAVGRYLVKLQWPSKYSDKSLPC